MREVVLHVPRDEVEDVLDRLLPQLPGGVRERELEQVVELRLRGDALPTLLEILALAGRSEIRAWEQQVPDDWRERRVADYVPDLIGGRLVVAPGWAPSSPAEIEIVLEDSAAFGTGSHPTTRRCLELLLGFPAGGSFADLGCGTGVLGIVAARLGFDPVVAVDISPEGVETARRNAAANEVRVDGRVLDLLNETPPAAEAFAANVPPDVHRQLAERLPDPFPRIGLVSGFHSGESESVLSAYQARGAQVRSRHEVHGWSVAALAAPLPARAG
jgi:ribosomal protein L11 methyltransferase